MNIVVLTGSPHQHGTSSYLAERFIEAAVSNFHNVWLYEAASLGVNGCLGCMYCKEHDDVCIQQDIMQEVNRNILAADLVVFVTPLYYMGMSAQLKAVIDRFYAINEKLKAMKEQKPKQAMLFVTCGSQSEEAAKAIVMHYEELIAHLGWIDAGKVIAPGYHTCEEIRGSKYVQEAYEAGKIRKP